MLTREILEQYRDLKTEIDNLENKIKYLEERLDKITSEGTVIDTVSGGSGGNQHFKVEGFPTPEFSRVSKLLRKRRIQLNKQLEQSECMLNDITSFISGIQDARMRNIIRMRIEDRMQWENIASKVGGSEDSIKKEYYRFFS